MTDLKKGDSGPRVKALQKLLNDNRYWHPGRKLAVDGDFGPLTAAAVQRAKYWLGYKTENNEPVAGDMLIGFLSGINELRPDMLERRRKRQAANRPDAVDDLQERIYLEAKKDVGILEAPNNRIKYNDWWPDGTIGDGDNDGGAYCVRAGSYWAHKAGFKDGRWENTDAMLADAKAERRGVHLTSDPKRGCGFVIDFSGRSDPDHYGVFVRDLGDGWFESIEANATLANGRQGVGYHKRRYSQCWFIEREG